MTAEEKAEKEKIKQDIEELDFQLKVLYKRLHAIEEKSRKESLFCPKCSSNDLKSHYNQCVSWSCNQCDWYD